VFPKNGSKSLTMKTLTMKKNRETLDLLEISNSVNLRLKHGNSLFLEA